MYEIADPATTTLSLIAEEVDFITGDGGEKNNEACPNFWVGDCGEICLPCGEGEKRNDGEKTFAKDFGNVGEVINLGELIFGDAA